MIFPVALIAYMVSTIFEYKYKHINPFTTDSSYHEFHNLYYKYITWTMSVIKLHFLGENILIHINALH